MSIAAGIVNNLQRLPRFQRIRYYGWQSPNCKLKFQYVQMLVWFYLGWCWQMKPAEVIDLTRPPRPCPKCKIGTMRVVMITDSEGRVIWRALPEHGCKYLDSG
jgi:hypothetical protein